MALEVIEQKIMLLRGQRVLLSSDLAVLYAVKTKVLNQAVARNKNRFPEDFMFQLTKEEFNNLKSQFVTSSWGGIRKPPYAFTEQGVAMLSSVLNSEAGNKCKYYNNESVCKATGNARFQYCSFTEDKGT